MIQAVKFVSIPVKDQDQALNFYTKKLGFQILTDQPFGEDNGGSSFRSPALRPEWFYSRRRAMRRASEHFQTLRS